jgi:capsule polysaccharide export protein KpsE/RkpR
MEQNFTNTAVIQVLNQYKKQLLIVAVVAAVVSAVLSSPYFIKPRYKSSAVIYPGNAAPYSTESLTEQLLEIFKSATVRDTLSRKFNLYKRYEIDASSPQKRTLMSKVYEERVNVDKTDYEAVSLSISDEEPAVAKAMLDSMISTGDRLLKRLRKEKQLEVVQSFENSRILARHKMDSLKAIVDSMRSNYGILDFGIQTKELYRNYYKAIASGNRGVDEMRKMIDVLKTQGYNYDFAYQESNLMRDLYIAQEDQYYKSLREYNRDISYLNIITSPDLPDKKHYPVRWLVVTSSVVFAMAIFLLVAISFTLFSRKNS